MAGSAAALFEVRFVLDCADGKLARARGASSATGSYLDYVGDFLVVGANLSGLALHLAWADDLPTWAAVALPAAFLAHITASQARRSEALAAGLGDRPAEERLPAGYRGWLATRRLRPLPSRIDAEHALLGLAPVVAAVLDEPAPLIGMAWVVGAYFAYRTARLAGAGLLIAMERDRVEISSP